MPRRVPILVLCALSALLLTACQLSGNTPASSSPSSRDAQTVEELRKAGADLNRPAPVDFYIYFKQERSARDAAAQLAAKSYEVKVESAEGDGWLCLATKTMVPQLDAIQAAGRDMEAAAEAHGGEYDGWEAAVVE